MAKAKTTPDEDKTPGATEQPTVTPTEPPVAPVAPPDEGASEEPAEKKGPGYYWVGVRADSRYQTIQAAGLNWAQTKQLVSASAVYLEELKTNEYLEVTPAEE